MSLFILDDMIVDESESHENKRVKITTACDTCRRRKVKCDGASPCANCTRGAYQCTFSDASTKRPRGPPKGFVALIEDRLHTIESLLVNLVNKDNINENNKEIKRERENAIEESNQRQRFSTFKIRQYSPTNVIAPATQSSPHLFIPTTPPADANYSSDQSPNLIPGFSDDLGSDDEDILLHNLVSPNSSNSLQSSTLSFLIPNNQQHHGGSYVDPPIPSTIPSLSNPPPEISRQLLEKYFNHFHPYFPIINRGQLFKMMSSSNIEDQPSPLLLNAIYAIGAMYPPPLQDSNSSLVFYDRARNLLDYFTDVPRLSTVQALILLCMVDQGKPSSYRPQTYSSMAIRMAQSMGLNRRNGAVYRGKGRQTKKLIWWGCFITDRLNSLANGDPLTINDKMCDIEFPSLDEVDDQDDDNQSQQNSQQQNSSSSSTNYSSTYAQQINIFINFIRLSRIIGQIIEHLQSTSCIGMPASWAHHAMINNFENSLFNWLRELPPFLQYTPSPQHMPLPGQIASLHMHHQTLFLILHYPYIASNHNSRSPNVRMSKTYIKSLNVCSNAAHVITHIGVEALNNVHACITFPIMFYSLGKAAKVHIINLTSPQRGLALNAFRNILKTIKICRFYEQHNIMAELANQMISTLENVLMSNQDRFSNEETIEISNVPPPSASSHIKISPTMSNQIYHSESISSSSKQMQPMDPKRESSSTSTNIQSHPSNFTYIQNQGGGMQQYMPVNQIFDPFAMQMQSPAMMMGNEISPNEPQFWDLNVDNLVNGVGGFNNNPYNNMNNITSNIPLPTTASSTSTPALSATTVVTSSADYYSQHQPPPQRQASLPVSSPIAMFPPTTSTKTHSRSNQMSLDSIDQDNDSGPNLMSETIRNGGLQNIHPPQRYVFMDTSDNDSQVVYEGYSHLSTPNETHQRIFNKIPRRMRKKEDENETGQIITTGSDNQQQYLSNKDALIVLSRRSSGHCGIIPNTNENGTPIGFGFEENNYIDGNINNNNSIEMKEVNVGFNMQHY
ncbi:fungal-specific transcription factor domain-containing protein [Glomus cerebriforme]|uniref:Fungal-specific transcription factor domain-containing protein n=1 Tax=Glomus cerebriforme TaxID=658196 RepID=A0A397TD99_9GLOM|nr:fungal-specific transcription factor domain-containing protein [Glomus cerebriforme]